MHQISNDEFKLFIESFSDYFKPITEISKENDHGNPLIVNNFEMYSFDEMKDDCPLFNKNNPPKSTDALYFKEEDGKIVVYFIEFKFHNLNKEHNKKIVKKLWEKVDKEFKKSNKSSEYDYFDEKPKKLVNDWFHDNFEEIYKTYNDSVEVSLRLKPFESLYITLPILFEDYCDSSIDIDDFKEYLHTVDIKYFIFVSTYIKNRSRARVFSKADPLNKQLERFKLSKIMKDCAMYDGDSFNSFLKNEHLI